MQAEDQQRFKEAMKCMFQAQCRRASQKKKKIKIEKAEDQ